MKHKKIIYLLLFLTVSLSSCTEEKPKVEAPAPTPTIILEGDDDVLVHVNGEPITRYDLDRTIRSVLGAYSASRLDRDGRQKVLESLVASRAIAQAQAANLSREERAALDKKVQAYREQLLVKMYLAGHAGPQPVSQEMVNKYYESHPERFGGKTVRTYQLITSRRRLKSNERDVLIDLLSKPAEKRDWKAWADRLQARGYPVAFRQGEIAEKMLHPKLRQLMKPLKKGEASRLSFIEGVAYVVRIVDEKKIAPRPLREVSAEIRKSLVPVQLKKAVKKVSIQALETAEVTYEGKIQGSTSKKSL